MNKTDRTLSFLTRTLHLSITVDANFIASPIMLKVFFTDQRYKTFLNDIQRIEKYSYYDKCFVILNGQADFYRACQEKLIG